MQSKDNLNPNHKRLSVKQTRGEGPKEQKHEDLD